MFPSLYLYLYGQLIIIDLKILMCDTKYIMLTFYETALLRRSKKY